MSLNTIYLKPVWSSSNIQSSKLKKLDSRIILFGSDRSALGAPEDVVLIKYGSKYKAIDNKNFEIDPTSKADFERLIKYLDPKYFVYNVPAGKDLEEELKSGVYPLLFLSQALQKRDARVLIISLNPKKELSSFWGLGGAIRTCMIEATKHHFSLLQINGSKKPWKVILEELENGDKAEVEVKWTEEDRKVRGFRELKVNRSKPFKFKKGGVYLITGGLGGLGEILSQHLSKFKTKLVLTGRRKLNKELKEKVAQIERQGAKVLYVSCDVTKEKEVQELIRKARDRFKKIDGVIHSAGFNQDNFIINKTQEDLDKVLPVKTKGVVNLFNGLKDEKLGFFILFSSIAGLIGNTGQYDYAFANAFMDHFAETHEGVSSINWPLWRHGGMQVDGETEKLILNTFGIAPLETGDGINALEFLLHNRGARLGVLFGDREKLLKRIRLRDTADEEEIVKKEIVKKVADTDINREEFIKTVTRKLSDLLKVDPGEIDLDGELDAYGLDLVSATKLINYLQGRFKVKALPNEFLEHSTLKEFIEDALKSSKVGISKEELLPKAEGSKKVMSPELYHLLHEVPQDQWDAEIDKINDDLANRLIEELKEDIFSEGV